MSPTLDAPFGDPLIVGALFSNMDNSVHRIKYWVSERAAPVPPPSSLSPSPSTSQLVGLSLASMAGPTVVTEPIPMHTAQLTSGHRKRIKSYMKRCRMNPRHSQLNLEGYLLLPVQRIPRYRLLVSDVPTELCCPRF